jgi:hypothetical protein
MTSTDYAIRTGDLLALVKMAKGIIERLEVDELDFETKAWLEVVESRDYIMESIKNG